MTTPIVHREFAPVVPAPLLDGRARAEAVLGHAREEAERLRREVLAAARAEAAALLEAARARGEADAAARVAEVEQWVARRRAELAPAVAEAALAVARRVWRQPPPDPAAAVEAVAREGLAELADRSAACLRVHPGAADRLAGLGARVVPDPELDPGDCVLESPAGTLDARASVRARLALEAFAEALGRPAVDAQPEEPR